MVGPAVKLCEDDGNGDNLGAWNITDDTTCQPIVCLPRHTAPANGAMTCSNDNLLNSVCTFSCSDGYAVVGSPTSTCNDDGNGDASGVWSTQAPTCERIKCNDVSTLRNGVVTCTDGHYVHSVCTYKCTSPMVLYPENHNTTTCLSDTTWSLPPPCCTKACPPNAVVDLVIVLDSSSSVKGANWGTMKTFVKNIVGTLNVSPTGVRVGAFKYSENVDTSSQMFLNQTTNLRNFYRSFNQIKYKGQGTKTGKALRHAKDVILAAGAGNRPGVTDVLLTITDGRAQDDVLTVSNELRAMGVKTFVVGVIPGNGLPIGDQHLLDIAGSQDRVFKATGGFSDLTDAFASKLSQAICSHQCPA
uniref:VWFA domain-containing protein n=1 Tax=Ciona savignyi TaxID=51511 RepID=H2ZCK7_CIOSA